MGLVTFLERVKPPDSRPPARERGILRYEVRTMNEKQEVRARALEIAVAYIWGTSVKSGDRLNQDAVKEVEKFADLFLAFTLRVLNFPWVHRTPALRPRA